MIETTHRHTFVGTCPVDGSTDIYELVVTTHRLIPVELIVEAARLATQEPAFQESVTEDIKAHLGPMTSVRLSCTHANGVHTVTSAADPELGG